MTEQEWLSCTDPVPMLAFLRNKPSDRKFRLYACAECRQKWHWFERDQGSRQVVDVAERFANGAANAADLAEAAKGLPRGGGVAYHLTLPDGWSGASNVAEVMIEEAVSECYGDEEATAAKSAEQSIQVRLVRDVFGNPFRRAADPAWLTSTVVQLAAGIYADRAFDRLPILADALQDVGCENADILDHCRSEGPHVRGCWVVDLLLGKS